MNARLSDGVILSHHATLIVLEGLFALAAAAVMILGIFRLSELQLTESEVYFGSMQVMTFAGVLIALSFLVRLKFQPSDAAGR